MIARPRLGHGARRWTAGVLAAVLAGCSDAVAPASPSPTVPPANRPTTPATPAPLVVPPFVFAADVGGRSQLFRFRNDSITPLIASDANDAQPRSAAGRIVFTSDRDGNVEIYLTDLDATVQRRVTTSTATDADPALDPRGETIAFTSDRGGVPRVWIVPAPPLTGDAPGAPTPLETGSPGYIPEGSPAWSPDGTRLAFTSTRTGVSQVFVVPATGGAAEQVTHDAGGAFSPVWSGDGTAIVFVSGAGATGLRSVTLATGAVTELATDPLGVGEPTCNAALCLAVTDVLGDGGDIVAVAPGRTPQLVFHRTSREHQPAVLMESCQLLAAGC